MVRFSFKRGLRFVAGLRIWTLVRRTATKKLVFESETSEEHEVLSDDDVYARWGCGEWQVAESSLGADKSLAYQATPGDL